MMIKCPSDGCLWTGELRDKEVKTQNKLKQKFYRRRRVDSVCVKHDHFQVELTPVSFSHL